LNLIEEKLLIVMSTSLEESTDSEGLSWLTLQENVSHEPSPNVKLPFQFNLCHNKHVTYYTL
jgi:hypothetical protein